jgi:hypothetical protein
MALFGFGERLEGFPVPVLNERAARAGAGILFFFAMLSFMNAWLVGNFQPIRIFVVAFLIDFTLRIFVGPRYSPTLIIGQWMVRKQQPEWTGAPQKRFAWAIGFVLSAVMFWLLVVQQMTGPVNLLVCAVCLCLLFFETAFGICLGCKMYEWVVRKPPELCPGGVCAMPPDPRIQPRLFQGFVALAYLVAVIGIAQVIYQDAHAGSMRAQSTASPSDAAEAERCKVPAFAKAIGHEEMWKLHNNCK